MAIGVDHCGLMLSGNHIHWFNYVLFTNRIAELKQFGWLPVFDATNAGNPETALQLDQEHIILKFLIPCESRTSFRK
jgi:hypothetical protein